MKKILSLLLAFSLALSLAACGGSASSAASSTVVSEAASSAAASEEEETAASLSATEPLRIADLEGEAAAEPNDGEVEALPEFLTGDDGDVADDGEDHHLVAAE